MTIEITIAIFTCLLGLLFWFLKRSFERLDKSVDKIDVKVNNIDCRVANIEGRMGIGYSVASSPIRLTPKGEGILSESGAKIIVDKEENKNTILEKILSEPRPTNAYDAQEKTKQIIKEMADDQMFTPIKNYAFQKGIDLDVLLNIISIYFREFVLEKLGFKSEDLDKK